MTKFSKYLLLSLLVLSCLTSISNAQIKFDIPQVAHQAVKLPGKISGIAADTQKQVEHMKTYTKMLDGAKEGLAKVKKLKQSVESKIAEVKDKVTSAISEVQGAIDSAKSQVQGAIDSAKSQVQGAIDSAKSAAQGAISQAQNAVGSATSAVQGALGPAQELINAQTALSRSKSECDAKIKELESSRDASINKYKENNQILEQDSLANPQNKLANQEQIEQNNAKIAELEKSCQQSIAETKATYDELNKQYEDQISQLKSAATNVDPLSNIDKDSAKKALSGMFGGDAGGAMNEIIADNFYASGEEASSERNGEINHHRRDAALTDTTEVFHQAVKVMSAGDSGLEYTKSLQSNAQVTETTPAAVMLDLSLKVETLKVMLTYARLLVAEMKMMTAKDMIGLDKKLNNYNKDVTVFNLDDYEYKD